MRRKKVSDELKQAINELSHKEKNKLIFRLLSKDEKLMAQLEFQLLEDGESTEQRRQELKDKILLELSVYPEKFYSPGYLLMHLRDLSGKITAHVNVTKDKYGEVDLQLDMILNALELNVLMLKGQDRYRMETLSAYVVPRIFKILNLAEKLDHDYHVDFIERFHRLAHTIGEIPPMMHYAIDRMMDVNELFYFE